ncbi:nucleotidyltransferase domain-containing protein [Cupriavidus gilardii]|uniref:nucleotidyltransferase domain-containing protein n=1 Tax=Cupriavidus gilardii TaxID=82541 RepID=UPI003B96840A
MNRHSCEPSRILSAHPIDPTFRARIMTQLDHIERAHDVRVLYACESGSRAWGFASPDSDYDVRFVYVHPIKWYLTVEPQRDVIEVPIDSELDVSGWELRKALQLLHRSNPTLLEWLQSPVVYREDAASVLGLRDMASAFFSPIRGRYHYLSMAAKNFRGYLQGDTVRYKKYLYVLRPLLAVKWIDSGKGMPPMRFADLVAGLITDAELLREINELLALKMAASEAELGPSRPRIHAWIEATLAECEDMRPQHLAAGGDTSLLDAFLWRTVAG